jgi:hypothetical protein
MAFLLPFVEFWRNSGETAGVEHNNNTIMRPVARRSFRRRGCRSKPLLSPHAFC